MTDIRDIEAWIGRIGLADRQAFDRLYDATSAKLFGVCLRVLKDRAAAEDAMQDSYIKVWKHAGRYAVSGHSAMTWLITIARNTAIDRLRTTRPMAVLDDYADVLTAADPTPEQAAMTRAETARMAACLDALDDRRRAAVRGAYLDGQTYRELATQFDIPLNTMRTWLRRSLATLKECLAR